MSTVEPRFGMETHLARDLVQLKKMVLSMGGLVEEAFQNACRGLTQGDEAFAARVPSADRQIDLHELEIDEFGMKLLALYQPVAGDLRFIVATLKITNDLERIGDLAASIADRAVLLARLPEFGGPLWLDEMAEGTSQMLRDALDALVSGNAELAREVCSRDDTIDDLNRRMFEHVKERIKEDSESVDAGIALLSAARSIERSADLATNIAEDVVFLVEAVDIRHPNLEDKAQIPDRW